MKLINKTFFLLLFALTCMLSRQAQAQCTFPTRVVNTSVGLGIAISTVSSGVAPYGYSWSNETTAYGGPIDTVYYSGIYTVTVYDNSGCEAVRSDTITSLPCHLNLSLAFTKLSSYVYQFTAASPGTNAPGYLWSLNGSGIAGSGSLQTLTLAAGSTNTLIVRVQDGVTGCTKWDTMVVHVPTCSMAVSGLQAARSFGNELSIHFLSAGTSPYTYIWSTGSTNALDTVYSAGIYNCTVTDHVGCISVAADTVTSTQCFAHDSLYYVNYGGGRYGIFSYLTGTVRPAYYWSVSGGASFFSNGNSIILYNAQAGQTYTVNLNLIDSGSSCLLFDSITIVIPPCNVHAALTYTQAGNQFTFVGHNTGATQPSYNITAANGSYVNYNYTNQAVTYSFPVGGPYPVIVQLYDSLTNCTAYDTIYVSNTSCGLIDTLSYVNQGGGHYAVYGHLSGAARPAISWTATSSITIYQGVAYLYNTLPGQSYTVYYHVHDSATGCNLSDSIRIVVPPCNLHASITYTQSGNQYTFTGHSTGGTLPAYIINAPNGNYVTYTNNSITYSFPNGGPYPVTLEVYDSFTNCIAYDTVYIRPCALAAHFTVQTTPNYDVLTAVVSGGTGAYQYSWNPVQTNSDYAYVSNNGPYTLTVTDDTTGCTVVLTDTVVGLPCSLQSYISYVSLGGGQYQFTGHSSGATGPQYHWHFGGSFGAPATGAVANYTFGAGLRTVILDVSDSSGHCLNYDSITINVPVACAVHDSISYTVLSAGEYQFTAHPTGFTHPSYYWVSSNGNLLGNYGSSVIYQFTSGSVYKACCVITDSVTGCMTNDTVYLQPCNVQSSITYVNLGGNQYQFTAHSTGSAHPAYYWWVSSGTTYISSTSNTITYSIPPHGNYAIGITVQDSTTLCFASDTLYINTCALTGHITTVISSGAATLRAIPSGGTGLYNYQWSFYSPSITNNMQVNTTTNNGVYFVTVTDDSTGCSVVLSDTVSGLLCNINGSISYVNLGNNQYRLTAGITGASRPQYIWSVSNGTSYSGTPATIALPSGIVGIRLDVWDSASSCYFGDSITINVPCNLVVRIIDTVLAGVPYQQAWTTGSVGNLTYAWSDTSFNYFSINTTHHTGTNCVTVTDLSDGCTASACLSTGGCSISLRDSVTNATSCGGLGTVRIYVSGGTAPYQYRRGISGNWQVTNIFGSLPAGVDTFYVRDTAVCSQSIIVTINQNNSLQLTDTLTRVGCAYNSGSVHIGVYGGVPNYIYRKGVHGTWQSSNVFGSLAVGSDTFYVQDGSGCSRSIVVNVTRGSGYPTVAPTSNSPVTAGSTLTLAANAGGGATTYSWTGPNGFTSTSASPSISNVTTAAGGTYYVTASTGGSTSCNANGQVTVVVNGCTLSGSISASNNTSYAILTANITSGHQPYTYHWSNGASTSNILTVTSTGTYCVTVTDSSGCSAVLCDPVHLGCNLAGHITAANYSSHAALHTTVTGATGHLTYHWANGSALDSLVVTASGYYCVTVTDSTGCSAVLCDSAVLGCHLSGYVTNNSYGAFGLDRQFTAYPSGGTGPYTYHWSVNNATTQSVIVSSFGITPHEQVTVTDAYGCSEVLSDTTHVTTTRLDTICGTVFSDTNGDGVQDYGEVGLAGQVVHAGSYTATTNSSGHYLIPVPSGVYTITYTALSGYTFSIPVATSGVGVYSLVHITGGTQCGYNFGVISGNVTISGYVYLDANNNGVKDAGETGVGGEEVHVGPHPVYTNSLGFYTWTGPIGSYNAVYTPSSTYSAYTAVPGSHFVIATAGGTVYSGNNFGLDIQTTTCNIATTIIPITTITAGSPSWYDVYVSNYGTNVASGTMTFYYDPALTFTGGYPTPATVSTSGHYLIYNYSGLLPGQYTVFTPDFTAATTVTPGQSTFELATATDNCIETNFADNTDTVHQIATASWDPNVKSVTPTGIGAQGMINADQTLRYTIDFQNTGTAPAVNIVVYDSLSAALDVNTLHVVAASHPDYAVQVEGRQLLCRFSQIMLPDSAADQVASHGFITFEIRPVAGIADGTQIFNSANIFFDYNSGILTNTTLNTIDKALSIAEIEKHATITVMPNPFREYTTITVSGLEMKDATLEVTNIIGQIVSVSAPSADGIFHLDRGAMTAGVYIYNIKQTGKSIGSGKLVLEQ